MAISVIKADGTIQLFNREKVVKTCLRMGANQDVAEAIAKRIEMNLYGYVESRKILQMIFRRLRKYKPASKYYIDLRKAISLMKPKPDFEHYIQILLAEHDYEVTPNSIISGKCTEHEVDAIARKGGKTCIVEVKHHFNYHARTGLDISRIARAVFEDVTEGFRLGLTSLKIDEAMIVCNTKFSQHAETFAKCRRIRQIGWSSPPNHNLRSMIMEKKLYPVTYLKGLSIATIRKLACSGLFTLKQLAAKNPEELRRETKIPKNIFDLINERIRIILQ